MHTYSYLTIPVITIIIAEITRKDEDSRKDEEDYEIQIWVAAALLYVN